MKTSDLPSGRDAGRQSAKIGAGLKMIRQGENEREPLEELCAAIAISVFAGAKGIIPRLNFPSEVEKHEHFFYVQCEFLYFFTHLVNRIAINNFGKETRAYIHDKLSPLLLNSVVDVLFKGVNGGGDRNRTDG